MHIEYKKERLGNNTPSLGGLYGIPESTLMIEILKIHYTGDTYHKIKYVLYDRITGGLIEMKNTKVMKDNISHWREISHYARSGTMIF